MIPSRAIREKAMQLLAADTASLAPAALALKMALLMASVVPSELLTFADLTLASFDGSTPLDVEVGTQPEGLDPVTADSIITLSSPAGGWRWETTGTTNLPQTIYGVALLNNAGDTLLASMLLPSPVPLSAINQVVETGPLTLRQQADSIS